MRKTYRIFKAYLMRDAQLAASYRLAFVGQLIALVFGVVSVRFASGLIGANPDVARYGGFLPFAVIGFAMTSYLTVGFGSFAGSIRNEQMMGTLEALLMTPARLRDLVLASSIWNFFWTTLSAIVLIAAAQIFFGVRLHGDPGNLGMALLLLLLTTITFSCLGIVSASYVVVFKSGDPFKFLIGTASFMLGGVVYPVKMLPVWMQHFSELLPITHGLAGIRDLLLVGEPATAVLPQVIILMIFIAVGLPASLWIFRRAIDVARREGSLVHY